MNLPPSQNHLRNRPVTHRSKVGIILAFAGLFMIIVNPNFATEDFSNPAYIRDKVSSDQGFQNSGQVYLFSIAIGLAGLLGVFINLLRGRLREF